MAGFTVGVAHAPPISFPRSPLVAETVHAGVVVLANDRGYPFGITHGEVQTYQRSIGEDVTFVAIEQRRPVGLSINLSEPIKGIVELPTCRYLGLTIAREVGRNETIEFGQKGDQVMEHVAVEKLKPGIEL